MATLAVATPTVNTSFAITGAGHDPTLWLHLLIVNGEDKVAIAEFQPAADGTFTVNHAVAHAGDVVVTLRATRKPGTSPFRDHARVGRSTFSDYGDSVTVTAS